MLKTTTPLLIALALLLGCQQNPNYRPSGEDEPFRRRTAHDRANDDARNTLKTGRKLAAAGMHRAEDPSMQNIRVEVTHIDDTHREYERLSARLDFNDGDTVASAGSTFRDNGFAVSVVNDNFSALITGASRRGRDTKLRRQSLVVLSGRTGSMEVSNIRRRLRVVFRTPRGELSALETLVTGNRLVVSPTIVDPERELVRVRLWPELAEERADGSVEITGVQSEVVIRNGQTILLGANPEQRRSLAYSLLSKEVGSVVRQRMILLRVHY